MLQQGNRRKEYAQFVFMLSVLFLLTLSFVAVAVIFTVYEATAQHTVLTAINIL